jgi:hypothetical protein
VSTETAESPQPAVVSSSAIPPGDIALIAIGLTLLALLRVDFLGDDTIRYRALDTFLTDGELSSMKYSFVGPLFASPLWYLGTFLGEPVAWVGRFNLVLLAVGVVAFYFLLRGHLPGRTIGVFLLLLVCGSMFPQRTTGFGGEPFTALLIGGGLAGVFLKNWGVAWIPVIVGVANTPAAIGGMVLAAIAKVTQSKRLRHLLAVPVAAMLILLDVWIRGAGTAGYLTESGFKTVLPFSGRPGFSYPMFFGLISIVMSFGRGLLFFAPGLFLSVRRVLKSRSESVWWLYLSWLLVVVGMVLSYSKWWSWYGGVTWGPRFFLFASIPAALAIAVRLERPFDGLAGRLVLLVVLALSLWVGVNGASFSRSIVDSCVQDLDFEHLCWYVPEFSSLWAPLRALPPLEPAEMAFVVFGVVVFIRLSLPLIGGIARDVRKLSENARRSLRTGWKL